MKKLKKWILRKFFAREIKAIYSAFEKVADEIDKTQLKAASRNRLNKALSRCRKSFYSL